MNIQMSWFGNDGVAYDLDKKKSVGKMTLEGSKITIHNYEDESWKSKDYTYAVSKNCSFKKIAELEMDVSIYDGRKW